MRSTQTIVNVCPFSSSLGVWAQILFLATHRFQWALISFASWALALVSPALTLSTGRPQRSHSLMCTSTRLPPPVEANSQVQHCVVHRCICNLGRFLNNCSLSPTAQLCLAHMALNYPLPSLDATADEAVMEDRQHLVNLEVRAARDKDLLTQLTRWAKWVG